MYIDLFFLKDDLWLLTEQTAEDLFVSFAFISYDPQIAHADCGIPPAQVSVGSGTVPAPSRQAVTLWGQRDHPLQLRPAAWRWSPALLTSHTWTGAQAKVDEAGGVGTGQDSSTTRPGSRRCQETCE